MVGIFVVPSNIWYLANGGHLPFGSIFKIVYTKVHVFILLSGLLSLMVIAIARYIAVVYPLRYTTMVTQNRARITVAIIWLVSAVFGAAAQISDLEDSQNSSNMTNTRITELSDSQWQSEQIGDDSNDIAGSANKISLWTNLVIQLPYHLWSHFILSVSSYT